LVGKSQGKRKLGKPKRTWEDILNVSYEKCVRMWSGLIWLGTRTGMNTVMDLWFQITSLPDDRVSVLLKEVVI
jgi:hypothetical protein